MEITDPCGWPLCWAPWQAMIYGFAMTVFGWGIGRIWPRS